MTTQGRVILAFRDRFGAEPSFLVRAPGRVNLIGEHTDYSEGFVLPMAIDRAVWMALGPTDSDQVHVHSCDYDRAEAFSLGNLSHGGPPWVEYLKGVAWALQDAGYALQGWEGSFAGDVPIGAGLSSSAALELATARAFAAVSGLDWDPRAMAKLAQKAENEWVGVRCGIMDQMVSAAGRAGHALLIDCRSLATQDVPLPAGTVVVVMDTATRRGLADSAYNQRRAQTEAAARFFGVTALRDVSRADLEIKGAGLDEVTLRRARHVVSENERTLEATEAMRRGDAAEMGRLMNASHTSLKQDFEVSSPELDAIVECAVEHEACYGARMTGAGFGGCAVALVRAGATEDFSASVARGYRSATGREAVLYVCEATDGATVVGGKNLDCLGG